MADINLVVAVTGHRPDKLGGYRLPNPTYNEVITQLKNAFENLKPTMLITGMALGVDQWAAQVALEMGIPFWAAVPFDGQEGKWPEASRAKYQYLISRALGVTVVTPGPFSSGKMQLRNQWMVDRCHRLLAVWNGTSGGTANCVGYATKIGRTIDFAKINFPSYVDTPTGPQSLNKPTYGTPHQPVVVGSGEPKKTEESKPFSFKKKEPEEPVFSGRVLDIEE
jgi:uncharacterized phage-like protein YoqJ